MDTFPRLHRLIVVPAATKGETPTEDDFRALGYVPADETLAHVRDLEGQVTGWRQNCDEAIQRATAAESRHTAALAQCARVEQRAAAAEMAQGARSDEMCRYITAICLRKEGGVTGPFSADETEAKEAAWSLSNRLSAAERERDEARAEATKARRALDDTAKAIGEQLANRGFECAPERERYTTIRVEDALDQLMHERDTAMAQTEQVRQDRDSLRTRLAAAERNSTLAEAARNTWLDKANEQHDRLAATERVVEAAKRMQRYNRSDPLNAALDALNAAPAAEPASPKPDTCGECFHVDSIDGCKFVGVNPPPRSYGPNMKACRHFSRRLPVVQPARTCGECKDMGRLHCERYATSCTAWPAASDPACPAFVGKDGGK